MDIDSIPKRRCIGTNDDLEKIKSKPSHFFTEEMVKIFPINKGTISQKSIIITN